MKKTVKVLMLPRKTDEPETGSLVKLRDKLYLFEQDINFRSTLPQHLYFTSEEEIKEGDYIHTINIPIEKVKEIERNRSTQKGYEHLYMVEGNRNQYKPVEILGKIIATTDKSLNLPLIPQSFVEEYVKKNGEIKEVEWNETTDEAGEQITELDWSKSTKQQTVEESPMSILHTALIKEILKKEAELKEQAYYGYRDAKIISICPS